MKISIIRMIILLVMCAIGTLGIFLGIFLIEQILKLFQ